MTRGSRLEMVVLVLLALAARGVFFWLGPLSDGTRALNPDARRYLFLADNLRTRGVFGLEDGGEGFTHVEFDRLRRANGTQLPLSNGLRTETFRTPGYPAFIALTGGSLAEVRPTLVAQSLCGALCAAGVFLVALTLGVPRSGALCAGTLWALHPAMIVCDLTIGTESLFNSFTVLALVLSTASRAGVATTGAGLVMGINALVRPLLGLFYLPLAMLVAMKRRTLSAGLVALMLIVAVVPTVAWSVRNMRAGDGFRVSWVNDMNLLFYYTAFAMAEERNEDWGANWEANVHRLGSQLEQRLTPGADVPAAARQLALEELLRRPVPAFRVLTKSSVKLLVAHSLEDAARLTGSQYQPTGLFARLFLRDATEGAAADPGPVFLALAWTGLNVLIACTAFMALGLALFRKNWGLAVGCGLPLVLFVAATGAVGLERMRLPMMLPLFLLCGSIVGTPLLARMSIRSRTRAAEAL